MKNSNNMSNLKRYQKQILIGATVICILVLPLIYQNPYVMRMAVLSFIYSILSMSLNLLLGFTGILSLGHAAFFGLGAYVTGILTTKMNVPFLLVLLAAAILPTLVGLAFGSITLKSLRHLYFGLAVWGLGEILYAIYMNVDYLGRSNGIRGIPEPSILGLTISSDLSFYYFTLVFAIGTLLSLELIVVSRVGRAFVAIREDEIVAGVMGIDVVKYQVIALGIASFYAGIAGSLYAYYETYISPGSFTIWESVILLCMVLVGGRRSLIGSTVGAVIILVIPEVLRELGEYRMVMYGAILLLVILFRPKGLVPPVYFLKPAAGD